MSYLATARRFTPETFTAHFEGLDFAEATWSPRMFVLHNTGAPSLTQWLAGGSSSEQRLANLAHYYQGLHWHSGPHWFVAPDAIWEFCDPLSDGVHCSCANHVAFGCEMIGDYATEPFDHGRGAQVRDNAVHVIATVFKRFGWRPDPLVLWECGLAFHHHCAHDRHDCPGRNVDRADVVTRVLAAMGAAHAGVVPASGPASVLSQHSTAWLQAGLNTLGQTPVLAVDGRLGPLTRAALAAWQARSNLVGTGEVSPVTLAALERALAA